MLLQYHLTGGVTASEAKVLVSHSGSDGQAIKVHASDGASSTTYGPVTSSGNFAVLLLDNLAANTKYEITYEIGGVLQTERKPSFRTLPTDGSPASFRVCATSCAGNYGASGMWSGSGKYNASNQRVWAEMINRNPLLTVVNGDWGYLNAPRNNYSTENWDAYKTHFLKQLEQPNQMKLWDVSPVFYVFDDHDSTGKTSYAEQSRNNPYVTPLRNFWDNMVPDYDIPGSFPSGAIYKSVMAGRTLIIGLDERTDCDPRTGYTGDPDDKTMLGDAQKSWLKNLINTTSARGIIIVSGSNWMGLGKSEGWENYPNEAQEIGTVIKNYNQSGGTCVFLEGNIHYSGLDDGTNCLYADCPRFVFSSMESEKGGASAPSQYFTHGSLGNVGMYGTLDIEDDGTNYSITGTIWADGIPTYSMTV